MKKSVSIFVGLFFGLALCFANVFAQDNPPKSINGGVLNGKAVTLVKPEYPPAAKAVNASGTVNVQVTIDEDGKIISASAVSGHPLLRQAAEKAALASKFSPTRLSGNLVKVFGIIVYNFVSSNPKKPETEGANENDVDGGVINGKAISLPKPVYPPAAQAVKAGGAVNVQVTIDEEGNVISAAAVSGHPLLRQSAEKAAMDAKFEPTKLNDKPIKVTGILVYNFGNTDNKTTGTDESNGKIITGGIINGKAINLPKPVYSKEAKKAKAEGAVNVQVIIDEDGNVISAEAVSGHTLLRESAEQAAKNAKFSPTLLSGKPVKVKGIIVYNFVASKK